MPSIRRRRAHAYAIVLQCGLQQIEVLNKYAIVNMNLPRNYNTLKVVWRKRQVQLMIAVHRFDQSHSYLLSFLFMFNHHTFENGYIFPLKGCRIAFVILRERKDETCVSARVPHDRTRKGPTRNEKPRVSTMSKCFDKFVLLPLSAAPLELGLFCFFAFYFYSTLFLLPFVFVLD